MEDRIITIRERELMEIMAEESSDVLNSMSSKNASFSASMVLFMATFSAGVLKKIEDRCKQENPSDFEGYHYSEKEEK